MNNAEIFNSELFECKTDYIKDLFSEFEYPWQSVAFIGQYTKKLISDGLPGFTEHSKGVYVGKNVTVSPLATIIPPAVIGDGTEIRPGAYIRGNVITGRNCVIGNSTEIKNAVLLDNVQVPHYNYVGDSILGNGAHMGAGAVCSNLKSDKTDVTVKFNGMKINTGLKKLGGILADGAEIGCGCVLNPGTVVGKSTSVYPLTSLRGVYPKKSIVKSTDNVVERKD